MQSQLIVSPPNLRYAFGFVGLSAHEHEAYGLIIGNKKYLLTDARYIQAEGERDGISYRLITHVRPMAKTVAAVLQETKVTKLTFEADQLRVAEFEQLKKALPNVELVAGKNRINEQRALKTPAEKETIARACAVGDTVFGELVRTIYAGQTEKEVAHTLRRIVDGYNSELAFDPIIAAGPHSALAHYNTKLGDGVLASGSCVLIDMGVMVDGYVSDVTRMLHLGKPDASFKKRYEALCQVQQQTIAYMARAASLRDVDQECRRLLKQSDLPDCPHSIGHGIGLDVHEAPKLSPKSKDRKKAGQVVTVEPGIYFPGEYGIRIEDSVYIKEDGVEVLTRLPRSLVII